jgi:predicted nucleotidyltransferase
MSVEWLFPRARWVILKSLFSSPGAELHVKELIRQAGGGSANVQDELRRFAEAGLLYRTEVGNQVRYRANTDHPLYAELRSIVLKTAGLVDVLREAVAGTSGIRVAFVYGSVAKGEDRPDSDIDLLVVGTLSFRKLVSGLATAQESLGRELNPSLYSTSEFREKIAADDHFLGRVLEGPRLFVVGDENDLRRLAGQS